MSVLNYIFSKLNPELHYSILGRCKYSTLNQDRIHINGVNSMVKFDNTQVFNFEGAIRGMRNPMNSWVRSDSKWVTEYSEDNQTTKVYYKIGNNDLNLMKNLIKSGPEHRKFLRQIFVSVDISAPLLYWSEFDTYKIGTTANSCSTMHRLMSKELTFDDFSIDANPFDDDIKYWNHAIEYINGLIRLYKESNDNEEKTNLLRRAKQALPSGYIQKRTVTMSYENVWTIYTQRKNHRLKEWNTDFVNWAASLPYFHELFLDGDTNA